MYAELFVTTGDFEYLNNMEDFDATSVWVSKQSSEFVASFIKQYGPLIESENEVESDTYIKSLGEECVVMALKTLTEEELHEFILANMAKHKVPRYITFVDSFPMNAAGKILKYKMRENAVEMLGLQAASKIETA